MQLADDQALLAPITAFISGVGIPVAAARLEAACLLPGVTVRRGGIVYDPDTLAYPGDLLHEAGHIAVTDPAVRPRLSAVSSDPGEEMAAIAWSYAAARAIGIDPKLVLHDHGYQGGGTSIADNFAEGRYFGVPLLEWFGMAATADHAAAEGIARYPHMLRWLR